MEYNASSEELGWLKEATIEQMQTAMDAGTISSKGIVLWYLARIASYDKQGATINAVLEINPDALHLAEALDVERVRQGKRGMLHGIPLLLKDNIDTADKLHTSAGSLALANSYASEDSHVAKQLREAGAVILGKANMTEWANFMTDGMSNGYSSRGGQVRNPYGLGVFDVGGSSSGSAAAVAANLTAVAIGTETSGSILNPASLNSIVGIKPTVGLISRRGIIPIAHSQDTAGPMAPNVEDAVALLGSMTGVDERDPVTLAAVGRTYRDYTQFLDEDGLHGARIGVVRDPFFDVLKGDWKTSMENVIEELRGAGAVIIDARMPSGHEDWGYEVLLYEFKPNLNAYLSKLSPHVPVHSLEEVIAFNRKYREQALRYGQSVLIDSQETSGTLTEAIYLERRAKELQLSQEEGIDEALNEHQLDALLLPGSNGCHIAAKAGYPSITAPAGYTSEGEPIGVTFTGTAFCEPTLIKLAYAFEQRTKLRVSPKLQ